MRPDGHSYSFCGQMAIPIPLWLGGHSNSFGGQMAIPILGPWLPQYYCIPYQIGYRVGEGLVSKPLRTSVRAGGDPSPHGQLQSLLDERFLAGASSGLLLLVLRWSTTQVHHAEQQELQVEWSDHARALMRAGNSTQTCQSSGRMPQMISSSGAAVKKYDEGRGTSIRK